MFKVIGVSNESVIFESYARYESAATAIAACDNYAEASKYLYVDRPVMMVVAA